MKYEQLRILKSNSEVRDNLNKKSKESLVNYNFKNLPTATNNAQYLRKCKEQLVSIFFNHYTDIRRDEALNKIIL